MTTKRPILFNGEMVKAILDGRKTQTRRVIRNPLNGDYMPTQCQWYHPTKVDRKGLLYPGEKVFGVADEDNGWVCPFGAPGDRLWVKELHWRKGQWFKNGLTKSGKVKWRFEAAMNAPETISFTQPPELARRPEYGWYKRTSLFMPRWASRITLEITEVRVQRVQEIHRRDAQAEGVLCRHCKGYTDNTTGCTCVSEFQKLWDSCGYNWAANPWTWAISFKRIKP